MSLRFRSPVRNVKGYEFSLLIKAPDRTFEALVGSMNCNFSVTFIKSLNQSSITPCLIVHLVALWTLICFKDNLLVESRRSESVYSRFVSTINAFNGMLSRFIFFIDLIDSDHELKLISINQSINQLTTSFKCLSLLARRQK